MEDSDHSQTWNSNGCKARNHIAIEPGRAEAPPSAHFTSPAGLVLHLVRHLVRRSLGVGGSLRRRRKRSGVGG